MARDRKRAKQRRARQGAPGTRATSAGDGQPHRADLPGSLDHAGAVDEFDAALIAGAGGVPVEQSAESVEEGSLTSEADSEETAAVAAAPARERQPILRRTVEFLRASWAELQRVQWPDRRHVSQATAVVIGFVAVTGVYLGVADWLAQKIVDFIL